MKLEMGSNRSFGVVFFVVFLAISLWPLTSDNNIRIWSLIISFIFLALGLINSILLSPMNKLWFKFGILLGKFMSPLIMAVIFFIVVTPIGLIMRLINKDLLNLKFNKEKTYWKKKDKVKSEMKNQF
ncbi:SxtJ family membrane protein [Candidatus Pelagibacter sp.]|nr:SxtJ family membrane protein [Candidatus Pelagibacter sp.]